MKFTTKQFTFADIDGLPARMKRDEKGNLYTPVETPDPKFPWVIGYYEDGEPVFDEEWGTDPGDRTPGA